MPFSATPPEGLVTLSANARTVLDKRYLVKDTSGKSVEQPEDMFWRVATVVAEADRRYGASDGAVQAVAEEFYFLMTQRRFEPNSPTLMNAGRPLGQLSACFVLPVDDALSNGESGIYDTLRSMALIHQSGGGTGFSFSRLRAKGSMVRSTTGVASGPVSFMELYDASTNAVKQGGTRRGANMGILRVDHPDVLEFIGSKEDLTKITNFNISVGITTKFMDAVKVDGSYDLFDQSTGRVTGQVRARDEQGERIRPMQQLRNCNVTTVAPTGTISIIAGCSSGLEPLFAVAFMRNQAGVMMPDVNEDFVAIAKTEGWYSDELMERIAKTGTVKHADVPLKWQAVFNTANNIAPVYHIQMQAAFQDHCDSAISKTTNFGYAATQDDVRAIYEMAYDMKCKGVTVYRDGSRDNQVLSTGATQDAAAKRDDAKAAGAPDAPKSDKATTDAAVAHKREVGELQGTMAELQNELDRTKKALFSAEAENANRRGKRSRPEVMRGTTIRKETPLGVMFVNITEDEKGQPFEVFLNLGKAGGSAMADAEAIGRLVSLALRSGISLQEIHRQLRGISSDRAVGLGPNKVLSLPDAVGIALEQWWRDKQGVQTDLLAGGAQAGMPTPVSSIVPPMLTPAAGVPLTRPPMTNGAEQMQPIEFGSGGGEVFMGTCPDCGSQLEFAEGCVKCHGCGFSECG